MTMGGMKHGDFPWRWFFWRVMFWPTVAAVALITAANMYGYSDN